MDLDLARDAELVVEAAAGAAEGGVAERGLGDVEGDHGGAATLGGVEEGELLLQETTLREVRRGEGGRSMRRTEREGGDERRADQRISILRNKIQESR